MAEKAYQFKMKQRVRIIEEDGAGTHLNKMATVERIGSSTEGVQICDIRIDRSRELISLPQRYLEPVVTMPSSLFANDLSLPWDPNPPKDRLTKFVDNNWLAGYILEHLLFYDRIIIPTVDYSIIVPLIHWLGVPLFKELVESHSISFVRMSGDLAYIGNGVGLAMFEIRPGEGKEEPWWVKVHRCSPKEATTLQLQNRLSGLKEQLIDILSRFVELCTVDTALPEFQEKVANETYRDIQASRVLTDYFFLKNPSIHTISLNRLPGIEANQTRVFTMVPLPAVSGDEIDCTLRLAMLNLEAYLAEEAGARDSVTDTSFSRLLDAKANRYTGGKIKEQSFAKLLTIEKVPDVISAVMSNEVSQSDIWKFRNTRTATEFRKWFEEVGPSNPDAFISEYVASLKSGGVLSSGKGKVIRFFAFQAVGVSLIPITSGVSFIVTLGLSAVDCFLLDKVRLGFRPRYFVDEVRHLFPGR